MHKNTCYTILATLFACTYQPALARDWSGLIDARLVRASAERSWTDGGLGKLRYDAANDGLRLGQAVLRGDADVADTVSAVLIVQAADDRPHALDITEAWLRWNPLPTGPWKASVRAGTFFPALSLENDGVGWTTTRTISSSAINSWIGEELRNQGVELTLLRRGRAVESLHDIGVSATLLRANDPIGTLLTWRGWGVGDRISGLHEALPLADLPVYRADGMIPKQTRAIHPFRELDGRIGYQFGAHYGYAGMLTVDVVHYDNRANPLTVVDGQYSWRTRFDHVAASARWGQWTFLLQAMDGSTLMGAHAAAVKLDAAYVMASHALGRGQLSLRVDRFVTRDIDVFPSDPNGEHGRAVALAYAYPLAESWSLIAEALDVASTRAARTLAGEAPRQRERSLTTALRWRF